MAKKIVSSPVSSPIASPVAAPAKKASPAPVSTPVRNTPVPPRTVTSPAPAARKSAPTYEAIALRAYYIWKSGTGGSDFENWVRAERELRGI